MKADRFWPRYYYQLKYTIRFLDTQYQRYVFKIEVFMEILFSFFCHVLWLKDYKRGIFIMRM